MEGDVNQSDIKPALFEMIRTSLSRDNTNIALGSYPVSEQDLAHEAAIMDVVIDETRQNRLAPWHQ